LVSSTFSWDHSLTERYQILVIMFRPYGFLVPNVFIYLTFQSFIFGEVSERGSSKYAPCTLN
jgi:hypothetical protein